MTPALFLGLAAWLALAAMVGVVMARRGHSGFTWALVTGALGPLALPLVLGAVRRETRPAIVVPGEGRPGSVDVVVGIDGSADAEEALDLVVRIAGPVLAGLHLVSVVDFEDRDEGRTARVAEAQHMLDDMAARYRDYKPTTVVLAGRPADQLASYAADQGAAVVAVGARGAGNAPVFVGSVADRLTRVSTVPVLVGGARRQAQRRFVSVVEAARALGGAGSVELPGSGRSEHLPRAVRP